MQAVKVLESLAAGLLGADDALGVYAFEVLWVRGGNGEIGRTLQGVVIEKMPPPEGDRVKDAVFGMQVLHAGQGVVVPVHHHLAAAGVIGLLRAQAGEVGALHGSGDDQTLSLLNIQAHPGQKPGIFLQSMFHIGFILSKIAKCCLLKKIIPVRQGTGCERNKNFSRF